VIASRAHWVATHVRYPLVEAVEPVTSVYRLMELVQRVDRSVTGQINYHLNIEPLES
jgi:hypothetical protein